MIFPFTAGSMSDFMILIHLTRLGYAGQCGSKKGPFFSAGPFCPKALGMLGSLKVSPPNNEH